jgi:hypothetical protein
MLFWNGAPFPERGFYWGFTHLLIRRLASATPPTA